LLNFYKRGISLGTLRCPLIAHQRTLEFCGEFEVYPSAKLT